QQLLKLVGELPESSAFSADNMALGGHTLGRILLGTEPDKMTQIRNQRSAHLGNSFTWASYRDGVAISDNALTAGYDSGHLFRICRVTHRDNRYVGYTWGDDCWVGLQDRVLGFGIYEVLTNAETGLWLAGGAADSKAKGALKLSAVKADGKNLNICRARVRFGEGYIGWTMDDPGHLGVGSERPAGEL